MHYPRQENKKKTKEKCLHHKVKTFLKISKENKYPSIRKYQWSKQEIILSLIQVIPKKQRRCKSIKTRYIEISDLLRMIEDEEGILVIRNALKKVTRSSHYQRKSRFINSKDNNGSNYLRLD